MCSQDVSCEKYYFSEYSLSMKIHIFKIFANSEQNLLSFAGNGIFCPWLTERDMHVYVSECSQRG